SLAQENRYGAVPGDREERVDLVRIEGLSGIRHRGGQLLRLGNPIQREADDEGGTGFEKRATFKIHFDPAASSTALTMRWCVPHRHRLPASAPFTSSLVGLGDWSSSATAVITMP